MDFLVTGGRVVTPTGVIDPGVVGISGGRVVSVGAAADTEDALAQTSRSLRAPAGRTPERLDVHGATVYPGFIDLHIHGSGGGDAVSGSAESLRRMAAFLATGGTTAFLGTTMTAPRAMLDAALRTMAEFQVARGSSPEAPSPLNPLGARLIGAHLEGPFINPARKGAQPAEFARRPSVEEAAELIDAHPGLVRQMTLAPELPGGLELVRYLRSRGVVASIGHSDATYEQAKEAFRAGVTHSSHTYSAMRGLHHREPGTVGAVLLTPSVTAEVIADGVHAHPAAVELLVRVKGPEGVALVTDAIPFAGLPEGCYDAMDTPVMVQRGAAYLQDGQTLAGSTLTMAVAVSNIMSFTGLDEVAAAQMAALTPARVLGMDHDYGSIEPGKVADLTILGTDGRPAVTVVGGRVVWRRREGKG